MTAKLSHKKVSERLVCIGRCFYTYEALYINSFTSNAYYSQTPLHASIFIVKRLYKLRYVAFSFVSAI